MLKVHVGAIASVACATALVARSGTVIGTGAHRVDVTEDIVWQDSVPANGVQTVCPGVFYPVNAEGKGPKNVEQIVFKNVKLADIKGFSAKIGVNIGKLDDTARLNDQFRWVDALVVTRTVTEAKAEVQFHNLRSDSSRVGTNAQVLFQQKGDDVSATLQNFTYFWDQTSNNQQAGVDWIGGVAIPIVDSLYKVGDQRKVAQDDPSFSSCIGYLSCTLKDEAAKSAVPREIVFRSAIGEPADKAVVYAPYLMKDFVVIGKDLFATNLVSASGVFSSTRYKAGEYAVNACCLTNDTVNGEKVFIIQRNNGKTRSGSTIRVAQSNEYVIAKVEQSYFQHDGDSKTDQDALGYYLYKGPGAMTDTTNVINTSGVAISNLTFTFSTESIPVASSPGPITLDAQLVWPGVRLADVELGPALMGGGSVGSRWHAVNGWFTTNVVEDTVVQSFYQLLYGSSCRTIRVEFQQEAEGVYARVASLRYNSTSGPLPYWNENLCKVYDSVLTNTVDGVAHKENGEPYGNTLALTQLLATRRSHASRMVSMASGLQAGIVPVRLVDTNLSLAPGEGGVAQFPTAVTGNGRVIVANGTTLVAASQALDVPVAVSADATLAFSVTGNEMAQLSAPEVTLTPGSTVKVMALTAVEGVMGGEPQTYTVIPHGVPSLPAGVLAVADGAGFEDCKAALTVEDGALKVTVARRRGFQVIVR
mgnify:FL=1